MLTNVVLYGSLGDKYGKYFKLNVRNVKEAIKLLCANFPSMRKDILNTKPGFKILVDNEPISNEQVENPCIGKTIRIIPLIVGAGRDGRFIPIVVGVMLIATGYGLPAGQAVLGGAMTAGTAVSIGTGLLLSGISSILFAPDQPKIKNQEEDNKADSFAFNGPVNTVKQGNAVSVLYGKLLVGSQVISAGLRTQQINPLTGAISPIAENTTTYAKWSPFDVDIEYAISNADYTITKSGVTGGLARATLAKSTGKWYFEIQVNHLVTADNVFALSDKATTTQSNPGSTAGSVLIGPTAITAGANYATPQGTSLVGQGLDSAGSFVVNVAIDLTDKKLWIGKNGTWILAGNPTAGLVPLVTWTGFLDPLYITEYFANDGSSCTLFTGEQNMTYTAPVGFNTGWYE